MSTGNPEIDMAAIHSEALARYALAKSMVVSEGGGPRSNAQEQADAAPATDVFRHAGILEPPYNAEVLAQICENSSALRPSIDAYVINIDSYGHTLKPLIDLESPDSDKKIKDALRYQTGSEPTAAQVSARRKELEVEISNERQKLDAFFESCAQNIQFSGPEGLRGLTRMDLETTGNAYWEVLRNGLNEVTAFTRLPAMSMRLTRLDKEAVQTSTRRRTSLLTTAEVETTRRYRRYVQNFPGSADFVFYKEFGDPRVISSKTGKAYKSVEDMQKEEDKVVPATEVISFKISSPRSEYGIPRWIGVLLAVLGNRQAEEVNFMYFDNKSIPPLAVLVSGGRLNENSVNRLQEYIKNNLQGRKNFHSILILEAESSIVGAMSASAGDTDNGKMKIEIQPLTEAQQKDGLFLQYDERNADKIGQSFRLPRLLRGDIRDFNRSTALAALDFAEVQVFNPLRQQFDWVMNRLMFEVLSADYHKFVSEAATIRDPEALAKMIEILTKANVLTPAEARELSEDVFHRQFLKIDEDWTKQPVGITVSGRNQEMAKPGAGKQGQGAGALSVSGAEGTQAEMGVSNKAAEAIVKIHNHILEEERKEFLKQEREVIKVPTDLFLSFFE